MTDARIVNSYRNTLTEEKQQQYDRLTFEDRLTLAEIYITDSVEKLNDIEVADKKIRARLLERQRLLLLRLQEHPDKKLQQIYNEVKSLEDRIETKTQFSILTDYMFLTICPPDDTPLSALQEKLSKYCKKVKVLKYLYVIEQRGEDETEIGKGLHAHILILHTYLKFSDLKREFHNTFKNLIDIHHEHTDRWLNIKHCKTDDDARNRITYMTGMKKDECKHQKQSMDVVYRNKNKIEKFYEGGDLRQHLFSTPIIENAP